MFIPKQVYTASLLRTVKHCGRGGGKSEEPEHWGKGSEMTSCGQDTVVTDRILQERDLGGRWVHGDESPWQVKNRQAMQTELMWEIY